MGLPMWLLFRDAYLMQVRVDGRPEREWPFVAALAVFAIGWAFVNRARVEVDTHGLTFHGVLGTRRVERRHIRALTFRPRTVRWPNVLLFGTPAKAPHLETNEGAIELRPHAQLVHAIADAYPEVPAETGAYPAPDPLEERRTVGGWLDATILTLLLWTLLAVTAPERASIGARLRRCVEVVALSWLVYDVVIGFCLEGTLGKRLVGLLDPEARRRPLTHAARRLLARLPSPGRPRAMARVAALVRLEPGVELKPLTARMVVPSGLTSLLPAFLFAAVLTNTAVAVRSAASTERPPEPWLAVSAPTARVHAWGATFVLPESWGGSDRCRFTEPTILVCRNEDVRLALFQPDVPSEFGWFGSSKRLIEALRTWHPSGMPLHVNPLTHGVRHLVAGAFVSQMSRHGRWWIASEPPGARIVAYERPKRSAGRAGRIEILFTLLEDGRSIGGALDCRDDRDIALLLSTLAVEP